MDRIGVSNLTTHVRNFFDCREQGIEFVPGLATQAGRRGFDDLNLAIDTANRCEDRVRAIPSSAKDRRKNILEIIFDIPAAVVE
jgi:hypothetical protein